MKLLAIYPLLALLAISGCRNLEDRPTKVLVGGTLLNASGAVTGAVVVTADGVVRAIGTRANTPIPQDSERVDVAGEFLLPMRVPPESSARQALLDRYARSSLPPPTVIAQATARASLQVGGSADIVVLAKDPRLGNKNWWTASRFLVEGKWVD